MRFGIAGAGAARIGLIAGLLFGCSAALAQVDMTTPGLFNQLGVSSPGDDPGTGGEVTPAEPGATPEPVKPDPVKPGPITPPPPPKDKADPVKPPTPPVVEVLQVFIAVGGQTTGPFDAAELTAKVRSGELTRDTYVWIEGMAEWKPAKDVPELRKILASAPPPPPDTPTFDALKFISGTWQSDPQQLDVPGADQATITGTVEYRRDKTFEGFGSMMLMSQGFTTQMNFTLKGTFELQNISEKGFVITQKGTATYHTPNGPFTESASGSFNVQILDQNTLLNADGTRSRRIR